jgi:hypothetical protein
MGGSKGMKETIMRIKINEGTIGGSKGTKE